MNNKIIGTATRTVANVFALGIIAAGAIFSISLLKASGDKMVGTLVDDVKSFKDESGRKVA